MKKKTSRTKKPSKKLPKREIAQETISFVSKAPGDLVFAIPHTAREAISLYFEAYERAEDFNLEPETLENVLREFVCEAVTDYMYNSDMEDLITVLYSAHYKPGVTFVEGLKEAVKEMKDTH